MNLHRFFASLLRVYSGLAIVHFALGVLLLLWPPGDLQVRDAADLAISAIVAGAVWIYTSELSLWIVGEGKHPVGMALRAVACVFVLAKLAQVVRNALLWITFHDTGPDRTRILTLVGTGPTYAFVGVAMLLVAVALMFLARPIGAAVEHAERVRELRKEIANE